MIPFLFSIIDKGARNNRRKASTCLGSSSASSSSVRLQMAASTHRVELWHLLVMACVLTSARSRSVRAQNSLQALGELESEASAARSSGTSLVLHKRLFLNADCRGSYAPYFEGYLNRVQNICKECADMYPGMREFITRNCTSECFRNRVFQDCLSATMQLHHLEEIHNMISQLSGRK